MTPLPARYTCLGAGPFPGEYWAYSLWGVASASSTSCTGFCLPFPSNLTLLSEVWRLSGNGSGDVDQGCLGITFTFVHLHGVLMYAAWGLFLPIGALLGRYYRWTWPLWFVLHVICQVRRIWMGMGQVDSRWNGSGTVGYR